MIVDVRLVLGRDGRWCARVEGRLVPGVSSDDPAGALAALARRLEGAAWTEARPVVDVVADPASALYRGGAA